MILPLIEVAANSGAMMAALIGGVFGITGILVKTYYDTRKDRRSERKDALIFEEAIRRELLEGQANVVKQANDRADRAEKRADELGLKVDSLTEKLRIALAKIDEQEQQIRVLKREVYDLQVDRQRQTTEAQRQTVEGERQSREAERQTVEGERLHQLRREIGDDGQGGPRSTTPG